MALSPGIRLGPYEIVSTLGAGGMGEVYRARDTRLKRDVAIKVLPASVAQDAERLRRFEQEALATAALNHPNILVVFDIGSGADSTYVALELLEGRTLREVIAEATVPVRKAVDYATQIALGLAAAHAKGIVHRDLKPENLFVTTEDRVKILDFGLAKVADASNASGATSTVLAPRTEPGMVVGTIGYMAPEQVRGLAIDHRADIFSFGAVLYELLTGARAFRGDTAADTMTAILKEAPPDPLTTGRPIPAGLSRVVERCLEKQPAARFQSASDLAFALQALGSDVRSTSGSAPIPEIAKASPGRFRSGLVAAVGLLIGGAIGVAITAILMIWMISHPIPPRPMTLDIAAPAGWQIEDGSAISPDGSQLAFTARNADGERHLWIRAIAGGPATLVANTVTASFPFWSPDGASVAFFTSDRLRATRLADGHSWIICDVKGSRRAGSWNRDNVIVFSVDTRVAMRKVKAEGGATPEPIGDHFGYRPFFLPDGRHVLATIRPFAAQDVGGFGVIDIVSGELQQLRDEGGEPKYVDGHVIFVRERQLLAQPFDAATRTLSGEPVQIAEIGPHTGQTATNFSVSDNGLLAFARMPDPHFVLRWYTRNGAPADVQAPGSFSGPELSPDDGRLAVLRTQSGTVDLMTMDTRTGALLPFASGTSARVSTPIWTTDGHLLRFTRTPPTGSPAMFEKPLDGGSERPFQSPLKEATRFFPTQITADGLIVAFYIRDGNRDVVTIAPNSEPKPFAQTTANETQGALSPNGRWMAYVSDAEGGDEAVAVWVEAFPEGGRKVRASGNIRGVQPRWRDDGKELYFLARNGDLMAAAVTESGGTLTLGPPQRLFRTRMSTSSGLGTKANYDVTRDGSRFIVAEAPYAADGRVVTVLVNWARAQKK